jgi:hypothetical protein
MCSERYNPLSPSGYELEKKKIGAIQREEEGWSFFFGIIQPDGKPPYYSPFLLLEPYKLKASD